MLPRAPATALAAALLALCVVPVRLPAAEGGEAADPLGRFGPDARARLQQLLQSPDFDGRISAHAAGGIAASEGKSVDAVMLALLPLAEAYARPPLSNFRAGTVARGASGDLYLGANLEFPGHPLANSVHSEQAALSNAYQHGESRVESIACSDAPCGYCRQFMYDFSPQGELRILVAGGTPTKLADLLPAAFGPADLGMKGGALPLREVDLAISAPAGDRLAQAAWKAARRAYAPYTRAYSGLAVVTREGRIFSGSYIENAAYNPSFPPLQAALMSLVLAGGKYSDIAEACLVEVENAAISQESDTRAVLGTIAPGAKLRHLVGVAAK